MMASPGGDDAADGVHRRLQHDAVLRRADVDAAQLILGGDLALDELADLVVGLAQILGDLADHVLVDLDDLQFGFGDLAPRLRRAAMYCARFARQPGEIALQHRQARELDQALLVELADADQFLLDQRDFLFLGLFLRRQPCDFLVELQHPLAQLRFLPGAAEYANLEQLGLARQDIPHIGIVGAIGQHRRKLDLSRPRCSASSRAARAHNPFSVLTTMARLALTTVSSSRTTMSPALTISPSRTLTSPTTPPVGCCTFLTLESTTTDPARSARPKSAPSRPSRRTRRPAPASARGRRSDARGSSGARLSARRS
jgi:hypothetical protein